MYVHNKIWKILVGMGSVYQIKTSIHWKRSHSGIQNVVEKCLKLISNIMLQNKSARFIQEYSYTIELNYIQKYSGVMVRKLEVGLNFDSIV